MTRNLNPGLAVTLLDHFPEPVLYYSPICEPGGGNVVDFEVVYCNDALAGLLDVDVEDMMGKRILSMEYVDETTREAAYQQLVQVYRTGNKSNQFLFNSKKGLHFQLIRTKIGDGVLTIARNTAGVRKDEEERDREVALVKGILDTSVNAIFSCEAVRNETGEIIDLVMTRINPAFTKLIGKEEREVIGKRFTALFPASITNGIFDMNREVIRSGMPVRKEMFYSGDGLDAWYDISLSKLGENGLVVTFSEINAIKQHEKEPEAAASKLESVFTAAQPSMFTFLPERDSKGEIVDFRFTMANPSFAAYVQQKPEAIVGDLGSKWFPGYLTNGVFDMYKHSFETGEKNRREVHYNVDGHDIYLDLQSVKSGDEVLITFTDHTPLRKAQLDLEKTIEALRRSNTNLEEFAHAASHDLKEPLRKIHIFSERLEATLDGKLTEEQRGMFDRMLRASERMQLLVDDLLSYSHVSTTEGEKDRVNLELKVQLVIGDLELLIEEKRAEVITHDLPVVKGYRRQLQQLIHNLLVNALKYSKPGLPPKIILRSRLVSGSAFPHIVPLHRIEDGFHLLEVEDNGIGFEQEYAERIFGMFQRLHGKVEYSGSGIGLSIARRVVENHQGFIWAKGVPDVGATFYVLLPVG